jgi:hypothetical protein
MTDQMTPNPKGSIAAAAVDVAGALGAASITYGAWQVYHPAAFIAGGLFLLIAAWLLARKGV